jgi:Tfp pilus assembly protein PilN
MRPINLIPAEQRRRSRGTKTRSGPLPYLLVGALVLLLVGVLMLVHYSNQVHDREDNVARLEVEKQAATAKAAALAPYTAFAQVTEQRTSTIAELADARFDWARVIEQLSLVLPPDVYLTGMNGSAGGGGSEGTAVGVPSLSMQGCAPSQDAVGAFVVALKQIDGITRVSLETSALSESEDEGGGEDGGAVSGASPCSAGGKAQFAILALFDFAPSSPDGGVAPAEVEAETPEGESEGEEAPTEESTETEGASEPEPSEGESASAQSASAGEGGAAG